MWSLNDNLKGFATYRAKVIEWFHNICLIEQVNEMEAIRIAREWTRTYAMGN